MPRCSCSLVQLFLVQLFFGAVVSGSYNDENCVTFELLKSFILVQRSMRPFTFLILIFVCWTLNPAFIGHYQRHKMTETEFSMEIGASMGTSMVRLNSRKIGKNFF